MNRRTLLVWSAALVVAVIAAAGAVWARRGGQGGDQSVACLDMRRCGEGQKPPACCKPPPCAYFRQIEMKAALQQQFASRGLQREALRRAGGDPVAAARVLEQLVLAMARDGTLARRLPSCAGDPTPEPPGVTTGEDCARYVGDEKMSEDQAHRRFATCGEFLQAAYRHEDLHKERCESQGSTARAKMPIDAYAEEEVSGYERELASLRDELHAWYGACSATVDAATRAQTVRAGVRVLRGGGR